MSYERFEVAAEALERVCELLRGHGDHSTSPRLLVLVERLRSGDRNSVISAISEATGGMGSLRDRFLCPENGDQITSAEVHSVNEQLVSLVKDVEAKARAVATCNGIQLFR